MDSAGQPLVQLRMGLMLLDADSLAPLAHLSYHQGYLFGNWAVPAVVLLPDGRSAAALPHSRPPERLWLLRC